MKGKRLGKTIQEINKPRGFDRGLELKEIVGAANVGKTASTLMFLVQWKDCEELDLISAKILNTRAPEHVIAYYEKRSPIHKRLQQIEKDRFTAALRPTIISKAEPVPITENPVPAENDEIMESIETEVPLGDATTMVEIPQDFNSDMPNLMDNNQQEEEWNAVTEEQTV